VDAATELAQASAKAMYDADDASRALGIEIDDVHPGRALARLRVGPSMVNGHRIAHGGYVFLLADTAFAFACNTYGAPVVARSAEITFVAPVYEGDQLVATAVERHRRGRSGIYDVTVRRTGGSAVADPGDPGEIVAEFRGHSRELRRG
jgi:acyl-CoA thioesterase